MNLPCFLQQNTQSRDKISD